MNILIHSISITKKGGSSRHLNNYLSSVSTIDKKNKYFVLINSQYDFSLNARSNNINIIKVKISSFISRFFFDLITLRKIIKKNNINVLVSLLNFGCILPPIRQINFQRGPTYYCNYYLSSLSTFNRIKIVTRRILLWLTMLSSIKVITPTRAMGNMIRNHLPYIPDNRFIHLPHGFSETRFKNNYETLSSDIKRKMVTIPHDVFKILYISHLLDYKGHDILVDAARILSKNTNKFTFIITIERKDWTYGYDKIISSISKYNLANNFVILDRVPEHEVIHIYKDSDMFIFPSLCESFGFPMVEAMSMGLPIVAAGTSVNKEICGNGAIYYSPLDYNDTATKIRSLIENVELRNTLKQNASVHLKNYHINWDEYVRRFLDIVNKTYSS